MTENIGLSTYVPVHGEPIGIGRVLGYLLRHPQKKRIVDVKGFIEEWTKAAITAAMARNASRVTEFFIPKLYQGKRQGTQGLETCAAHRLLSLCSFTNLNVVSW